MFSNADWLKYQDIWLDNPLVTVDASEIENIVNKMHKNMSHCIKVFQENPSEFASLNTVRLKFSLSWSALYIDTCD